MRVFIAVLVLIFSFQSWTKADDISEFEIEGISIGDSALDYFSEQEIKQQHAYDYKNKQFSDSWFKKKWFKTYGTIQITYKLTDKSYKIHGLDGTLILNYEECLKKQEQVYQEVKSIFNKEETKRRKDIHNFDKTGNSYVNEILFLFENGYSRISCFNWSDKITKEKGWDDHLRVTVGSKKLGKFFKIKFK